VPKQAGTKICHFAFSSTIKKERKKGRKEGRKKESLREASLMFHT